MINKHSTIEESSRTREVQKRVSTTSSGFSTCPYFSFDDGDNSAKPLFLFLKRIFFFCWSPLKRKINIKNNYILP